MMAPRLVGGFVESRWVCTSSSLLARESTDVLYALLQFVRGKEDGQRGLERRQRPLDIVSFHFCGIDANTSKSPLDRAFGEHRRQPASLNYLVEKRIHAIVICW